MAQSSMGTKMCIWCSNDRIISDTEWPEIVVHHDIHRFSTPNTCRRRVPHLHRYRFLHLRWMFCGSWCKGFILGDVSIRKYTIITRNTKLNNCQIIHVQQNSLIRKSFDLCVCVCLLRPQIKGSLHLISFSRGFPATPINSIHLINPENSTASGQNPCLF